MTLATDGFDRADSTSLGSTPVGGYAWTEGHGDFSISSGLLACTAVAASMATINVGVTDQDVQADLAPGGATGQSFLVARSTTGVDSGSALIVGFQTGGATSLELYKIVSGAYTLITSYAAGVHGGTVRLVVIGDAVTVYLDGVVRITYTITDAALRTGTRVGFYGGADANSRWDNFAVSGITASTIWYEGTGDYDGSALATADSYDGLSLVIPIVPANPPPVYVLEVAFTSGPLTVPGTWTDITAYARSASIRRGRNHELGRMSTGTMAVVLDNRDRRFDPTYTSSPYYPNVIPMRPIRLRATYAAITYDLFRGFVEDWGQTWPGPAPQGKGDAYIELSAADAFKVLQLVECKSAQDVAAADGPLGYWSCDEADTVGQFIPVLHGGADMSAQVPTGAGRFVSVAGPLMGGAPGIAAGIDPTNYWTAQDLGDEWQVSMLPAYSMEAWVWVANLATDSINFTVAEALNVGGQFVVGSSGGAFRVQLTTGLGGAPGYSTGSIGAGWHHIVAERDRGATAYYIDGVLDRRIVHSVTPTGGTTAVQITLHGGARVAHLAVYPYALSLEQIQTHAGVDCGRFVPQPAGTALDALLDAAGWPTGLRALDTGASTVTFAPSGSILDLMQAVAEDAEHGILEAHPNGTITFIGRDTLQELASLATFGDNGSEVAYNDLKLRYDDQDLWTQVIVGREGGTNVRVSDATAVTTYGTRTLDAGTPPLSDDNQVADQANGLLNRYKAPAVRPESLGMRGTRSVAQQFSRQLGDRITIHRNPPGGGTMTIDAAVEGISHDVPVDGWLTTSFDLAPQETGFWVLGTSALDSTTRLGW